MKEKKQVSRNTALIVILLALVCVCLAGYVILEREQLGERIGLFFAKHGALQLSELIFKVSGVTRYHRYQIEEAVRQGDCDILERYLEEGGKPNLIGHRGLPLIYVAASSGVEHCAELLAQYGANMNHHPLTKEVLLILASKRKESHAVRLLVENGCNPNLISETGTPIIYYLMRDKKYEMVRALGDHGADLKYRAPTGRTLADWAYRHKNRKMIEYLRQKGVYPTRHKNPDSPIFMAVRQGNVSEIEHLIQNGEDPYVLDGNGSSTLSIAAYSGNYEAAKFLLELGVDPSLKFGAPLRAAVKNSRIDMIKLLLAAGADPNDRRYPYYKTALHEAACKSLPIVKVLVEHGVNINAGHKFDGITALTIAKRCGKSDIVAYLEANGASSDAGSAWQNEALPLAIAAAAGDIGSVKALRQDGHRVNEIDKFGNTALHYAAGASQIKTMAFLIKKGAKPRFKGMRYQTPLFTAAANGQLKACKFMLKKGCKVNATDIYGQTPLHAAARGNHVEVAQLLIEAGADIEANAEDDTPLSYAAYYNAVDVARLLIERGANIHARTDWQRTPLHRAVTGVSPEAVKLLVEHGADRNAKDDQDITPFKHIPRASSDGQRLFRYIMKLKGTEIQAGFDCNATHDVIERMICVDEETAALDRQMAQMIEELNRRSSPKLRRELKKEQQQWLKQRYERCHLSREFFPERTAFWDGLKCLKEDYKERLWVLTGHKNMLGKK